MSADTYVQIPGGQTGPKVRTAEDYDSSGDVVETQAMLLTDRRGHRIDLLTEDTGQAILCELQLLRTAFCAAFGQPFLKGDLR